MNSPICNFTGFAEGHHQATAWTKVTYKRRHRFRAPKQSRSRTPTPIPPPNRSISSDGLNHFRRLLVGVEPNPGPVLGPMAKLAAATAVAAQLVKTIKKSSPSKGQKKRKKAKSKGKGSNQQGLLKSSQISRNMSVGSLPGVFGYNFSSTADGLNQVSKISVRNVGVRLLNASSVASGVFCPFKFSDGTNANSSGLDINPSSGGGFKPATFGPTIADMANLFTLWRLTRLRMRFVPIYGTSNSTTIFLCATPDPFDTAPASEFAVMSATPNMSFPIWQETEMELPPAVYQGNLPWYFTTIGNNNAEGIRQFAPCSIQGGTVATGTTVPDALVGYLFLDADLEFKTLTRVTQLGVSSSGSSSSMPIGGLTPGFAPPMVESKPVSPPTANKVLVLGSDPKTSTSAFAGVTEDPLPLGRGVQNDWDDCSEQHSVASSVDYSTACHITDLTRKAMLEQQLALIREKLANLDC